MTTNTENKSNVPALISAVMDAMRIPDLRNKILFTFGILVVFRFLAHVPVPGVDRDALAAGFSSDRNLLPLLFPGFSLDEETLKNESVKALAYLVASERMEFKVYF